MTTLELCEPLFQKICLLNRLGRKSGRVASFESVRVEIEELFDSIRATAEKDPALRAQWQKLEMPLVFFVDSMIAESALPIASQWNQQRLAYRQKELAGDEKFFDLLDETLRDNSNEASERLEVFYTCLGLGFTGWYGGQPEYIHGKILDVAQRIKPAIDADPKARISPEAYDCLDTRDLVEPPASRLGVIALLFAGLCLIVITVEIYLFRAASQALTDTVSAVGNQEIVK